MAPHPEADAATGHAPIQPRRDSGSSRNLFIVPAAAVAKVVYRESEPVEPFMV